MSKVIGITGTIGSGKSTVGAILEALQVPVIDTDSLVHDLLDHSPAVKNAIVARFGSTVRDNHGSLSRPQLAEIVFVDKKARQDLEAIIHPAVLKEMHRQIDQLDNEPIIAVLVPLLFEVGLASQFDEVWTVVTEESILQNRLAARDQLTAKQIEQRLAAQWPQKDKAAGSHHVIDNSGSQQETRRQIELLLRKNTA